MLYLDDTPDVEVGVLAPATFTPAGRVLAPSLLAGRVATAIHRGDCAGLGGTHAAILHDIAARRLAMPGSRWEVYGHWRENPDDLETEVSYLLRE